MALLRSRSIASCLLLACLIVASISSSVSTTQENAAGLLLKGFGRRLRDEDEGAVALKDRTFAFLTKYEENFNYSAITTSPRAIALWGWYEKDKSIKYAIVAPNAAADALTAATGADIAYIHLHVGASRGQNSTEKFTIAKAPGAFEVVDGYKVYAQGTITDANVTSYNSTKYKTASDVWAAVGEGITYTNIHTTANPDGEARGQNDWSYDDLEVVEDLLDESIRKNTDNWRLAFLTPYEQTGPVTGDRNARAIAIYGWDGNKIRYSVVSASKPTDVLYKVKDYKDLANNIHIHVGATRGENAGTIIPLKVLTDADWKTVKGLKIYAQGELGEAEVGTYTSNSANKKVPIASVKALWDMIAAGTTYTNIHTPSNPAGEVRGQNDWNYAGLDVAKSEIPGDKASTDAKSNFALSLKPSLSFFVGAVLCLLLLA